MVFKYTDTIPNEEHYNKLDKLLELEEKKEGLKINLEHFVDPELQFEAIGLNLLGLQFNEETQKDYLKDEDAFLTYLREKTQKESVEIDEAIRLLVASETIKSKAISYNEKLINNTLKYLKTKKSETNISVTKSNLQEPDNIGSNSKFKIKFNLLEQERQETEIELNKN